MKQDLDNNVDLLITKYSQLVFAIAMTHTQNRSDADDVFQNVFMAYFQKNVHFDDEEHRKAWLIRTTLNHAKKTTNSLWKKRTIELNENVIGDVRTFDTIEQELLFAALSSLKEKYRIVIHLFYFEELSIREIAKVLNRSESAIKAQLSRGRLMLKEKLKGDFDDEQESV